MFRKILCPTDFSDGSQHALRVAARLASEHAAELVLLNAWFVPPMMYSGEYIFPPMVLEEWQDDGRRRLAMAVEQARTLGAKLVSGFSVTGSPWATIVDVLDNQGFDLCVMGTHGRTGVTRILLGSVAEKVVRHAPCSVLAVRADGEPDGPFRHVLCPTDFSEASTHAVDVAAKLVEPGGDLRVLHVIEVPIAASGPIRVAEFARDLDARASEALAKTAARVSEKIRVTTSSRIGFPGAQTLAVLEADPKIDLVVMGSHGRTGLRRALLGSVAEKVVRNAKSPVMVVRERH